MSTKSIPNVWYPTIYNTYNEVRHYGLNVGYQCVGFVNTYVLNNCNTNGLVFAGNAVNFMDKSENKNVLAYFDILPNNSVLYPGDIVVWKQGENVLSTAGHVAIFNGYINGSPTFFQQSREQNSPDPEIDGNTSLPFVAAYPGLSSNVIGVLRPKKVTVDGMSYYCQNTNGPWKYYYGTGFLKSQWVQVYGAWYYLKSNSNMASSEWIQSGDDWYYLQSSGAMMKGWLKDNGKWYYLRPTAEGNSPEGSMVRNTTKVIDGKTYSFDSKGVCLNP